jgi:hypothetical protein
MDTTLFMNNMKQTFAEYEPIDPTQKFTCRLLFSYEELENIPTELEGWKYFLWEGVEERKGGIVVEFTLAREIA